jgi:hypothetical protein
MSTTTLTGVLCVSDGTAAEWALTTKVLPLGVLMRESDTNFAKIADGVNAYPAITEYFVNALGKLGLGLGVKNDGANNLTLKIADTSLATSSTGVSVVSNGIITTPHGKGSVSTGTVTFSYADGIVQSVTIAGPVTFGLSNFPSGTFGEIFIQIVNGGSATITWPVINWIAGNITTTSFAAYGVTLQTAGTDFAHIFSLDGVNYYGKIIR